VKDPLSSNTAKYKADHYRPTVRDITDPSNIEPAFPLASNPLDLAFCSAGIGASDTVVFGMDMPVHTSASFSLDGIHIAPPAKIIFVGGYLNTDSNNQYPYGNDGTPPASNDGRIGDQGLYARQFLDQAVDTSAYSVQWVPWDMRPNHNSQANMLNLVHRYLIADSGQHIVLMGVSAGAHLAYQAALQNSNIHIADILLFDPINAYDANIIATQSLASASFDYAMDMHRVGATGGSSGGVIGEEITADASRTTPEAPAWKAVKGSKVVNLLFDPLANHPDQILTPIIGTNQFVSPNPLYRDSTVFDTLQFVENAVLNQPLFASVYGNFVP
jgi:hypothetical protein